MSRNPGRDAVAGALEGFPSGRTATQIATATGLPLPEVIGHLMFLRNRGEVCKDGRASPAVWSIKR